MRSIDGLTWLIKHPSILLKNVTSFVSFRGILAAILGLGKGTITAYAAEADNFLSFLTSRTNTPIGFIPRCQYYVIYCICRAIKPSIVVETGVAAGLSSAIILEAMRMNNHGELYSVDLPIYKPKIDEDGNIDLSVLPAGKTSGYLVPQKLRNRWRLVLGKSKDVLPPLLQNIGQIDIFIHDSEHSYSNMMFEYSVSWPHIKNGGFLISDDITYNSAFRDFCLKRHLKFTRIFNLGIVQKIRDL